MPFEFGNITTKTKKKELSFNKKSPLIYLEDRNTEIQYCILFDNFYPKLLTNSFIKWIKQNTNNSFIILNSTEIQCTAQEISQVVDFYSRHTIDFKQYFPDNFNNIIYMSVGRAIYSFTGSEDLVVESFYDYIFNKTYFYSPKVKSYIFPIDYLTLLFKEINGSWVPKDASRTNFAALQFKLMNKYSPSLIKDTEVIEPIRHLLISKKDIDEFLYKYMSFDGILALDTETSSLFYNEAELGCITLCLDKYNSYYIDSNNLDKSLFNLFLKNKKIIGQNYKYDYNVLRVNGIDSPLPVSDSMILGQTLNEMRSNSIKAMAYYYTKHGGYENELEEFKKKYKIKSYLDIPPNILNVYASMDAYVTFIAHEEMQKQLDYIDKVFPPKSGEYTIRRFYEEIMLPGYLEFFEIESRGMYIDRNKCDIVANQIITDINNLEKEILNKIKAPNLKLNSPQQLGKHIEYELAWNCYGRRKDNIYSTGEEQLVRWIKDGHKEASLIQKYRSLNTILGMFVGTPESSEGWREYMIKDKNSNFYKMYPSYGVGMADSKRNICKNPNLQQVPSHGIYSKEIRGTLVPPPEDEEGDYLFATLDYASLQIRLCAINSSDSFLCNLYKTELDPDLHSTTGYELIKNNLYNFIQIEQDNTYYEFFEDEEIRVIRDNKEIIILAKNIEINDKILDKAS